MKITFIGTGHGVPEAHKQCSATLIETDNGRYLIDAGCDITSELADRRIPPESIKSIFITHPHHDHIDGLYPFLGVLSWYYREANPSVFVPNSGCAELVHTYLNTFEEKLRPQQKLSVISNGIFYDDGIMRVTAYPTEHCKDSRAFLVECENKRILFTGDLRNPNTDFPPVDNLDAVVFEGAHFPVTDYINIFKTRNIKAAYMNHYANYIGIINLEKFVDLKNSVKPTQAYITTDGMEISL